MPLVFARVKKWTALVLRYLRVDAKHRELTAGKNSCRVYNPKDEVTIGIVGKYVEYEDSLQIVEGSARPRRARHTT